MLKQGTVLGTYLFEAAHYLEQRQAKSVFVGNR